MTPAPVRVLIVEDEADQRLLVESILNDGGYHCHAAGSAEQALELLEQEPVDLVFSDWRLPGMDGLEMLAEIRARGLDVLFVLATAYGTIEHAVEAIRHGADDYLTKPYSRDTLLFTLERNCRQLRLQAENQLLSAQLSERDGLMEMIGKSPAMQEVYRQLERLANTDATVLLQGESGTGKELAARALHQLSKRSGKAFVAVNCGAIPESLAETEFFGAEKGAYTGAHQRKIGKFEAADGGTLFLDEIADLPLPLQTKILRVLQEGKISRLGSTTEVEVNFRLVAAAHKDLQAAVRAGEFREDLFYRLHVVPVRLPALRERREDIARLAHHFIAATSQRHQLPPVRFDAAAIRKLTDHAWPGNVRELQNVIERLVLLSDGTVGQAHLDFLERNDAAREPFRLPPGGLDWDAHERSLLEQALEQSQGNRSRAARLLGLGYKAFLYRMEKHGLDQSSAPDSSVPGPQ